MKAYFYDIESLTNVFTLANLRDDASPDTAKSNFIHDTMELYYLCDDSSLICPDFEQKVSERIYKNNKNFKGKVELYNLAEAESVFRLAKMFGLSDATYISNPAAKSSYSSDYRIVCDTDPEYNDDIHPYFFGYNSANYDTTMLTWFLYNAIDDKTGEFRPQTAKSMRNFNDELFTPEFKDRMPDRLRFAYKDPYRPCMGYTQMNYKQPTAIIRKNMLMTGRHLDVARLNEKQSKVGLKRILGMLGYQILESNKLRPGQDTIENADQLLDLFAYNVSDVVNLKKLFNNKTYKNNFSLKKQLLTDYPELKYNELGNTYKPDISVKAVRNDRLIIDSSSAQFVTKALCPYGHLTDYDTVSFLYPSEAKAKELGIPRLNILEETKKFFYANFSQPELRARFDEIYNYYKSIEGKNFNSSKNYLIDHNVDVDSYDPESLLPEELRPHSLADIPAPNTCMFYYKKDGTPSSCFVNFSTGGIHGAEYNERLYLADVEDYEAKLRDWQAQMDLIAKVQAVYPNPCDLKINKGIEIDGVKYTPSKFLKPKATATEAYYKDPPKMPERPEVFKKDKNSYNLAKRYAFTSSAMTNHEDFMSYYPNLLRMMDAFYNPGLGYDRYGEIFDNKTKYGILMKDKSLEQAVRDKYSTMREGTKLVLNSASGAADATFESNIRMNNKIISMRIIGQLFTWRIGQAQTIEGASMISTNTDGLYSVLEAEFNNMILERESKSINVKIEPEPIYLISKDSNNRAEITVKDGQLADVVSASGGTLSCRKGPNPTKSLAHPAIIDWALTEYLTIASIGYKGLSLEAEFDDKIGMSILSSARKMFNDDVQTLLMFQNIIASSPGSQRFVFATADGSDEAIPLQHYNRCFIVKDGTPGTYHLRAAHAKAITETTRKKRAKNNERAQQHDPVASAILAINGVKANNLPMDKEATVIKITGVEEEWFIDINNNDIHCMEQSEMDKIFDSLDYDKYLAMLHDTFENSWRNITPEWEREQKALKEAKKKKSTDLFDDDEPAANTPVNTANSASEEQTSADNLTDAQPAVDKPAADEPVANTAENTVADERPLDLSQIELPRMIQLNKTLLSQVDISNGEHALCMNGIREIDAHSVLAKLLKILTDTNIDE